jgi:hypothetical protein
MYDIEFHLAVTPSIDSYLQRFLDFKKYGLINIKDKNVKLKLLVGSEAYPLEAVQDWPVELEVVKHNFPTSDLLSKLYNYCPTIDPESARWFSRLDDDSITDISGLVDNLDKEYDHEREYYILSPFQGSTEGKVRETDVKLACDFGYAHWFYGPEEWYPIHEIEFCGISQSAIRRMLTTQISRDFLIARGKIWDGYGDIALAYAARMCKIYPTVSWFISHEPRIMEFSAFGGHLNHVHYLAHNVNEGLFNFYKRFVDGFKPEFFQSAKHKAEIVEANEVKIADEPAEVPQPDEIPQPTEVLPEE